MTNQYRWIAGRRTMFMLGLILAAVGLSLLLWAGIGAVGLAGNAVAAGAQRGLITLCGAGGAALVGLGFIAMAQRSGFGDTAPVRFDSDLMADGERVVVKVRCRACRSLNDEHAQACWECREDL